MDLEKKNPPAAWQPFTFAGVAAFATASTGRLLLVQGILSLACAACMAAFFHLAWSASITEAIEQSPDKTEIRNGELASDEHGAQRLGSGTFLSFVLDLEGTGELGEAADVECIFTRHELRVRSLLGYSAWKYPDDVVIALGHSELMPWWGARRPIILGMVAFGSVLWLLAAWSLLAALYAIPLKVIAYYRDRELVRAND